MALIFEWDPGKARANLRKHGVYVGRSFRGRTLVVVHTERGDQIRIISARRATRHEREQYEGG